MEILPIMTVAELQDLTLNDELLNLCSSDYQKVSKIINAVSVRIRNKIDKEIFYDEESDSYIIPDDLKYACASLCEGLYICDKEKNNVASKKVLSERIDDYSITYSESQSAYTFFWIPTDSNTIAIIEAYCGITGKWYWNIHLH